jgi:hypothetical protein
MFRCKGVSIEERKIPCIFPHDALAVGRFLMAEGCICFSEPEQDLCAQHATVAEPLDGMIRVIKIYQPDFPDLFNVESTS